MRINLNRIPEWLDGNVGYEYDGSKFVLEAKIGGQNINRYLDNLTINSPGDFVNVFCICYSFDYKYKFEGRDWLLKYPIELYDYAYNNLFLCTVYFDEINNKGVDLLYITDFLDSLQFYIPVKIEMFNKEENDSYKLKIKIGKDTIGKHKFFDAQLIQMLLTAIQMNRSLKLEENNSYILFRNNTINFKTSNQNSTKFKLHINKFNYHSIINQLSLLIDI